jgi:phosphatidylinositol alpha-1,6-mannosyltransferase
MDVVLTQDFFPQIGGAHLWLYEVYRRWPQPVRVLTRPYEHDAVEIAAARAFDARPHGAIGILRRDITVNDINLASPSCLRRLWSAQREITRAASGEQAVVHCLRAFPEGLVALLYKLLHVRARLIVYAHGEEILVAHASRQLRLVAGLVYRCADLVIANSANTRKLVHELVPGARVVVIHPGVDFNAFRQPAISKDVLRRQWGWPADSVVVITVSRMEPRKNQSAVLQAVATLRNEGLPIAYVCAGDGECRGQLERRARELGLAGWVHFPGTLSDAEKIQALAAADIFAMPSIRAGEMIEGFGIVFIEAAAAGLPSVGGDIGGQPEAVLDGQTGLVVDGRDASAIVAALRRLAVSPSERSGMAQAGQRFAATLDWSQVAARVRDAVNALDEQ